MWASTGVAACLLGPVACRRGASSGERVVVLDLIDAFPATDSAGPTMDVRAGDRGAADSFVEGWSPPQRAEDGQLVAWAHGPRTLIAFDAGPRPFETTVTLDCVVADLGHVPFVFARLNARPVGRFRVSAGAQQIRMTVRAGQQGGGRNVLDLFVPGARGGGEPNETPQRLGFRSGHFEAAATRPPAPHREADRLV